VLIRRAAPEEYEAAGLLTEEAYEEFLLGPDDYYRTALRDAGRRDREAELWVAVDDDGGLLGCVTSCPPGSPWRELSVDGEGEFRMLAVAPAARGRGAGEALVRKCEELALAAGATRMWLTTIDDMAAAHRIYTRLGYRHEPSRDWYPDEMPELPMRAWTKEL
jgi:ribosomal protein S18 acetylase RimI-like enzyme